MYYKGTPRKARNMYDIYSVQYRPQYVICLCVLDTMRVDDIYMMQDGRRRRFSIRAIKYYFVLGQVNGIKGKVTLLLPA